MNISRPANNSDILYRCNTSCIDVGRQKNSKKISKYVSIFFLLTYNKIYLFNIFVLKQGWGQKSQRVLTNNNG